MRAVWLVGGLLSWSLLAAAQLPPSAPHYGSGQATIRAVSAGNVFRRDSQEDPYDASLSGHRESLSGSKRFVSRGL